MGTDLWCDQCCRCTGTGDTRQPAARCLAHGDRSPQEAPRRQALSSVPASGMQAADGIYGRLLQAEGAECNRSFTTDVARV